MRPNKLSIQAFGPFAGTEEVNFDLLGSNPLFLINGPTGAGKSSILDAICFALYGQTTGKEREASHMRCDHADAALLTEITLDFSLGDLHYCIRRAPTQERPKSKGEGTTIHQTEAQLWQIKPEGDTLLVPKKAQEATKAIEGLTGLSVEQFRQVMVLPQGKFRDFLMADSSEREKIFSKLFQTQIYKRLEDALKIRASSIKKEVEALQHQIKGILQGADLNTENQVQEKLAELAPQLASTLLHKNVANDALAQSEKSLEAGKLLIKAFKTLEDSHHALNKLEAQKNQTDEKKNLLSRAQTAQKIEHLRITLSKLNQSKDAINNDINTTEKRQTQQQGTLNSTQNALTKAEADLQPLDQLKEQLADLRKLQPKISQLAKATADTQKAKTLAASTGKALSTQQDKLKSIIERITRSEERVITLKTTSTALPEKQRQLDTLRLLGQQRANLDKRLQEQNTVQQEHEKRGQALNAVKASFSAQDTQIKTLELAWHSNQAALLAAELKQGEPCPVCGSQSHPLLANAHDQHSPITKEDIEAARNILTTIQQQLTLTQNQVTETATQLQSIGAALIEQQHELGDNQYKSTSHLREEWKQLNEEVTRLQAMHTEQGQLEADLQALSQQRTTTEQQQETTRTAQHKAQKAFDSASQDEHYIEQALPKVYRQPGALNLLIEQSENKIKAISAAHDKALLSFNNAKHEVTQTSAKLKQQQVQFKTATEEHTNAKDNWDTTLSQSTYINESDFLTALLPEPEQQRLTNEIEQFNHQLSGCKATLEQQKKQLAGQQQPDMEQLQSHRTELSIAATQTLEFWKNIDNRHQQLTDVQKKLKKAHDSNQALEDEYKIYGTLSDVANGQTGNKISLQRFVLSVLLDDVLIEASHRLIVMSKGRYLLVRKEERAKGNKASGLELEVEDAYTGKTRPVATLSGGESFMAALSLALGLSDVVQAYAGGIKLDTLFIDEGFGSLDQESLDLAIKTLIDLQSSGRMIGIISHVSELREQMALRVDVHSSPAGSKISHSVS